MMLGLKAATNKEWIAVAIAHPDAILIDHAHCEKKAATFAMMMIQRYPDRTRLVHDMIDIAKEELEHLDLVLRALTRRKLTLPHDRGNPYAKKLHDLIRRDEPERLLDSLIVGALIEARSCERFSLLTEHAPSAEMREFYHSLLASEAGHYRAYTDIAREYFPTNIVRMRLKELCLAEAEIVRNLDSRATMHG